MVDNRLLEGIVLPKAMTPTHTQNAFLLKQDLSFPRCYPTSFLFSSNYRE